jgi:hypothetical protein
MLSEIRNYNLSGDLNWVMGSARNQFSSSAQQHHHRGINKSSISGNGNKIVIVLGPPRSLLGVEKEKKKKKVGGKIEWVREKDNFRWLLLRMKSEERQEIEGWYVADGKIISA